MTGLQDRIESLDVFSAEEERSEVFDRVLESLDPELLDELLDRISGMLEDRERTRLLDLVRDRKADPELRARAAIGLGPSLELWEMERDDPFPIGEPEVDPELAQRIHASLLGVVRDETEPKLVRRRAFEAAVRCISDEHVELIRKFRASDDPEWQLTAVFAMGHGAGWDSDLIAAARDASLDPLVRGEAFRQSVDWELDELRADAQRIAGDRSEPEPVREGALFAYATFAQFDAEELLQRIAEEESGDLEDLANALLDELEEGGILRW